MATESELRRLALIRFMYGQAVQQAMLHEALAGIAVLTLHDAAELFLRLVAEKVGEIVAQAEKMPSSPDSKGWYDTRLDPITVRSGRCGAGVCSSWP